jgi:hypothetical protein
MTDMTFYKAIAVSAAMVAATAGASEATQFVDPPSTWTRARAASPSALDVGPTMRQVGDATEFTDPVSTRDRVMARSPGDASASSPQVIQLGEATEFIDPVGTRSRADVLAEARAVSRMPHAGH